MLFKQKLLKDYVMVESVRLHKVVGRFIRGWCKSNQSY